MDIPADIFAEPDDIAVDTLANLGPLRRLAGIWEGKRGHDINPKGEGPEHRDYFERIEMQPIDAQPNGPQLFYGLRYHVHINTPEEQITFHDQVGYWLWEPATGLVLQTVAIPRGQVAIAAGHAEPDAKKLVLTAERGTDRVRHLLDHLPRTRLPHRQLHDRGRFPRRRIVELCARHHPAGARPGRPLPPPRPQPSGQSWGAQPQSVGAIGAGRDLIG